MGFVGTIAAYEVYQLTPSNISLMRREASTNILRSDSTKTINGKVFDYEHTECYHVHYH